MTELSGLQIFKYLPGSKKAEHTNCKACGCATCMAFALKLAKKQIDVTNCPYASAELKEKIALNLKDPQKTIEICGVKIGGENVLYRHEKTFVNRTAVGIVIDTAKSGWEEQLQRVENFEITRIDEKLKVDFIVLKNADNEIMHKAGKYNNIITLEEIKQLPLIKANAPTFRETILRLIFARHSAVKERDEKFANPVYVYFEHQEDLRALCARASFYICKYANMLLFEDFDETLMATLMTLRQNIFTDPQKPLQVEAKIYEFNNPDENSIIFMTTNFALTFYAVANELESLNVPSYLVVTPAEGMSVLTAWSAEKFTSKMVANTLKKFDLQNKVKTRKIIIPGLLAHMKQELEEEIKKAGLDFEITVGTIEAYKIADFVKDMNL